MNAHVGEKKDIWTKSRACTEHFSGCAHQPVISVIPSIAAIPVAVTAGAAAAAAAAATVSAHATHLHAQALALEINAIYNHVGAWLGMPKQRIR